MKLSVVNVAYPLAPVGPDAVGGAEQILTSLDRALVESGQRSSDHWSFVRDGLPGVRLGSTPYAAYHSATDVPSVVDPRQLERAARVVVSWLR